MIVSSKGATTYSATLRAFRNRFLIGLRLGVQDQVHYNNVSKYERDINERPPAILLAYARLATIPVELLIDDTIEIHAFHPHNVVSPDRQTEQCCDVRLL